MRDAINLYEQQSTFNPNIPVRFLVYAGMLYSSFFERQTKPFNIYSSKIQKLPVPKCICFYNGTQEQPDETKLYLSAAFPEGSDPDISVRVKMLNINYGHNQDLLASCRPLREYAFLIDRIRFYQLNGYEIEAAVENAIKELADDSVIKPFIIKNKAEVKRMCITEYDEVRTMNMFKEEGREEGREEERKSIMNSLISGYRSGAIGLDFAAQLAGMTQDQFHEKTREAEL